MVLLTFDIEEFDLPLEYGQSIEFTQQIQVSEQGLERILDVLESFEGVRATFYSTVLFMEHMRPELRERLLRGGHEIASHGVEHSAFAPEDYDRSRQALQHLTGQPITGFRMARMQPISHQAQLEAGYLYDSSLNPTYLPGRYNHLGKPRLPYQNANGIWTLPTSVVPLVRLPLFWLALHNLPFWLYRSLALFTERHDDYLNVYLHPWEFSDLALLPYRLPSYILRHSGLALQERLRQLIEAFLASGRTFGRTIDWLNAHIESTAPKAQN